MSEIVNACLLCSSPENSLFDEREFRGHKVTNRLCSNCGLVFQSPRMTETELKKFYETEYRNLYQGDEGPSQKDINVQMARTISFVSFVSGHITHLNNHLDIGSSTGQLQISFQKTFGSQSLGVEPGDSYRRYAQTHGLQVYPSLEVLKEENPGSFNLVTMAHVLEHFPDPVDYLINLRQEYLDKNGWLLIEVPNLYSHDSFEVAHLTAFSAHTLIQILQKAGFEIVAMKKHGLPRSQLLPLYLMVLARPTHGQSELPLEIERGVNIKRRLGMFRRRVVSRLFSRRAWLPVS